MNFFQTLFQQDVLPVIATPLQNFLTAIKPVNNQPISASQFLGAKLQLYGAVLTAGPQAIGIAETDLISTIQAELAAHVPAASATLAPHPVT
jgi:hypothetical protein